MITIQHLRSFGNEIKLAGLFDKAKEKATELAAKATTKAQQGLEGAGASIAKGMTEHSDSVGHGLGSGLSAHAEEVGRGMGRGFAEHMGEGGTKLMEGGHKALKDLAANPKVRAGAAAAGTLYAGSKIYGAVRQHHRDKDQRRIADALERMSPPKKG